MPVIIPEKLPANKVLRELGIFVMNEHRAKAQDIRPLKVCIVNLMPDKITTESQLLSMLSNNMIQVDITLVTMASHQSKNTSQSHLDSFYRYFSDIKDEFFDAVIFTGAPIEHLEFEDVDYWEEMTQILDWSKTNVYSSLFICWASQAALYHFYGIGKKPFNKKLFGVYAHTKEQASSQLFLGMDDLFYAPHSRGTASIEEDIRRNPDLEVIASSEEAGIHLMGSKDKRQIFMTGHPEYNVDTLQKEYLRDIDDPNVEVPENYFKDNDPNKGIITKWKSHGSLFYNNWLNYYVYQVTEYELGKNIPK